MKTFPLLASSSLALSVGLSAPLGLSAAFAATTTLSTASSSNAAVNNPATKDYAKLSIDGAHAFQDIGLARLAIFDGRPAVAVKLVADAQQAMGRAKTDNTVFMKTEAELKPVQAEAKPGVAATDGSDATAKIAWVPIDGELMLDETLAPTPEKAAIVAEANRHLRNGEPNKAREVLKVASVTADYTLAVAPLKQSSADIAQASTLLAARNYYGASQALKQAQDGVRYDVDVVQDAGGPPASASTKISSGASSG